MSHVIGRGKYGRETYPRSPGSGGGAAGFPFISVLNTAALAAFSVAGLVEGQPAAIRDRFSLWAYNPQDSSPADGWHIPSATGPGCWTYTGAFDGPTLANQLTWFIDPQNSTGTASDDNDGLTQATALLTKAEVVRRWGTRSPQVESAAIVVHYLSGDVSNADPGVFKPVLAQGASMTHVGALPAPSFTGTLNVVTPKNRGVGGNALQSTFTTATGAIAADMLLVNATRGNSRAFVQRNVSGGTWQLGQPMTPWPGSVTYSSTEVDTWASGDSITGYSLTPVVLADIGSDSATIEPTFTSFVTVAQLLLSDTSGIGFDTTYMLGSAFPQVIESTIDRFLIGGGNIGAILGNCACNTNLAGFGDIEVTAGFLQFSAQVNAPNPPIVTFSDTIVHVTLLRSVRFAGSAACIDSALTIVGESAGDVDEILYGGGTLNQGGGQFLYDSAAVGHLNVALELEGVATGYSNATAAGTTAVHGGIALTAANLDAAAGAAGFGGVAFVPGSAITNGTQP